MTKPIQYNVVIEKSGQGVQIDWGNTPNWVETHKEFLETADRITLVPKEGVALPVVSVALGEEKRWVIVSRVFNTFFGGNQTEKSIRLYAIGWQSTINGANVKNITWVYPNGTIENAEDPTFFREFLQFAE